MVFSDNEDHQHISITTLNDHDRLVAPVSSHSSDFPPNAPSPPSSSSTLRFTNLSKLLSIIAKRLEEEEAEGTEHENEFDLAQEPVYKTPPLTRLTESAPSQASGSGVPVQVDPTTTIEPIRPLSPPHFGPIPLPLYSFEPVSDPDPLTPINLTHCVRFPMFPPSQPEAPSSMETSPPSSAPSTQTTTFCEPLMIVAKRLEEEKAEGMAHEDKFDSVSRTSLIDITISSKTSPKVHQPVCDTSPSTEMVVPTPSQVLEPEAPIPAPPVILATTLGPLHPPSPPRFEPATFPFNNFNFKREFRDLIHRIGYTAPQTMQHVFNFEPDYVLAYGPFDALDPTHPNDPSGQLIDYCVYLLPTHGHLNSRIHFAYGGLHTRPIQIGELPRGMPTTQFIESFDRRTIRFISAVADLFRHGASPTVKIRIPRQLMNYPAWEEPDLHGNLIYHSPHIETMLSIAKDYVHYPVGIVAQAIRHIHPEFDVFEDYRITCICPECEDFTFSDEEEDSDMSEGHDSMTGLQTIEESSNEDTDPSPLVSPPISRPHSAPPQLPPSPRSQSPGVYYEGEMNPSLIQTNSASPGEDITYDTSPHNGLVELARSFQPVVLATTMGPFRPLPPSSFQPLPLLYFRSLSPPDTFNLNISTTTNPTPSIPGQLHY